MQCVMRSVLFPLAVVSVSLSACAATVEGPTPPPARSVRERLAESTALLIAPDHSSGSVTASRRTSNGWQAGHTAIAIDNGELVASTDPSGSIAIDAFAVAAQPIEIPPDVLGKPAELRDVRLALAGTPAVTTTWIDDDDATASCVVDLDLSWTLVVGTTASPLGTQHLRAIPVDVAFAGDGERVSATIGAHAGGDVWTWADLVKLGDLQLVLDASSR
jgi:hypothetical protein